MKKEKIYYYKKSFSIQVDRRQAPPWSEKVDRWYQLDHPSFVFCQAYWELEIVEKNCTDFLIIASDYASNQSDLNFVLDAPPFKPMYFVHTLPSIRAAPLLQLMQKELPVICISQEYQSLEKALRTAEALMDPAKNRQSVDIWSYSPQNSAEHCKWVRLSLQKLNDHLWKR